MSADPFDPGFGDGGGAGAGFGVHVALIVDVIDQHKSIGAGGSGDGNFAGEKVDAGGGGDAVDQIDGRQQIIFFQVGPSEHVVTILTVFLAPPHERAMAEQVIAAQVCRAVSEAGPGDHFLNEPVIVTIKIAGFGDFSEGGWDTDDHTATGKTHGGFDDATVTDFGALGLGEFSIGRTLGEEDGWRQRQTGLFEALVGGGFVGPGGEFGRMVDHVDTVRGGGQCQIVESRMGAGGQVEIDVRL